MKMNVNRYLMALLLLICKNFSIHPIPYKYERIALKNDQNETIKVVDLIWDVHVNSKNVEIKDKNSWLPNFLPTEQKLIEALKKLNKQDKKYFILWEIPFGERTPSNNLIEYGQELKKFFEKSTSIKFENCDTYRYDTRPTEKNLPAHWGILSNGIHLKKFERIKTSDVLSFLSIKHTTLMEKIASIKTSSAVPTKLIETMNCYVDNIKKLKEFIEEKKTDSDVFIHQVKKAITANDKDTREYRALRVEDDCSFAKLVDMEILVKGLLSDSKHIIVYAGGTHCTNARKILSDNFKIETIFESAPNAQLVEEIAKTTQNIEEIAENAVPEIAWPTLLEDITTEKKSSREHANNLETANKSSGPTTQNQESSTALHPPKEKTENNASALESNSNKSQINDTSPTMKNGTLEKEIFEKKQPDQRDDIKNNITRKKNNFIRTFLLNNVLSKNITLLFNATYNFFARGFSVLRGLFGL